ncbi:MAG: DNA-binding response regulator [Melioribacteraceae bacterium]|nr:MAG: DNA-binding response regulator [Melioribacteraceae bacterium]
MGFMRCIIVDDEEMSRQIIGKFVDQTDYLEKVGSFDSAIDASAQLRKESVDIIFLDIEMPEMSGMDLIKVLKDKPQIILITSEQKYAVEAFEYEVTDYLLKPLTYARFLKAVEKAKEKINSTAPVNTAPKDDSVFIKVDSRLVKLQKQDILYIEALRDYVIVHTDSKKYTVFSTMKGIEKNLPSDEFIRVHRSYIIRLDKILDIEDNTLVIKNKVVPIGPSYKSELMNRLNII